MKINNLEIFNLKKVKQINIKTGGKNVVVLEGKNAQGKTSTLDSIAYALGGKKLLPGTPVRHGQETAEITVKMDNYVVKRRWLKSGSTTLEVKTVDGAKISSAQSLLDGIIGKLSFDPMAFCNDEKRNRAQILKDVCGIDLSDLEEEYRNKYDDRTLVNRELKNLQGEFCAYADIEDIEVENISEIQKKRAEAIEFNEDIYREIEKFDRLKSEIESQESGLKELDIEIQRLQERKAVLTDGLKALKEQHSEIAARELPAKKDISEFDEAIASHSEKAIQKEKYEQKVKLQEKIQVKEDESTALTNKLREIEETKQKRLEESNMPIDGLDFLNGDVSYNGVEFSEISSAQKIKVSMAIAMALNPKLKVIRIMNGSLLDADAMNEIEKIAEEKDFQVWIERVANSKSGDAIYIEDGEVA